MNNTANAAEAVPHFIQRRVLHIVFASTSGHTEYVVDALTEFFEEHCPRLGDRGNDSRENAATGFAERRCSPARLRRPGIQGGIEGQLNPHMWVLLHDKAKTLDLAGKPCACIGLGDHRYFYTARAADHLQHYVKAHHGRLIVPTLKITDEPYGQEEAVRVWGKQLVDASKQVDRC